MGSFIFAFGLMRFFRSIHLNYYSQFYTILGLIFLFKINKKNSLLKNNIYFFLSASSIAMQFYSCYTLGWGFCVLFFTGVLFSLCFGETRKKIFNFFKDFYKLLIIYFIVFIILLIPFAVIYLDLNLVRTMDDVVVYLQDPFCWIRSLSRFDNLFLKDVPYVGFYECGETTASSGIFTTIFALIGLWFSSKIAKTKGLRWVLYFSLALIFFMSCTVGTFFMWNFLYYIIPGIQGIRAIVRISFIALIIISFGVAYYTDNLQIKKLKHKIILIISFILILIEQIPFYSDPNSFYATYNWSKSVFQKQIAEEVKQIPDNYDVLEFNYQTILTKQYSTSKLKEKGYTSSASLNALAMWASLNKNMYTVNGLSGVGKDGLPINPALRAYEKTFVFNLDKFVIRKYLLENKME